MTAQPDLFTAPESFTKLCWGIGPDRLLDLLPERTLDPTFEAYGKFISANLYRAKWDSDEGCYVDDLTKPFYPNTPGVIRFFGNFWDYSAVFCIDTNDPALIGTLTAAIRANQQTPAYAAAKTAIQSRKTPGWPLPK